MSNTMTPLYQRLSIRLGHETAKDLTSFVENKIKEEVMDYTRILATKQDIADIRQSLADMTLSTRQEIADMKVEMHDFRAETKIEIHDLRAEVKVGIHSLRTEMKDQKFEIIKWMFLFWIGQAAVTFGYIHFFLGK